MLTTSDIIQIMKKRGDFGGVYAINRLPIPLMPKPRGIIINMDKSWGLGTHWVSVYLPELGPAFYFDPFGGYPLDGIITFMERNSKFMWKHSEKKMQGNLSTLCGVYCIKFLKSCPNYNKFFEKFRNCSSKNDKKIISMR